MKFRKLCGFVVMCMLLVLCVGCGKKEEKSINERLIGKWEEVAITGGGFSLTFTSESTMTIRDENESAKCNYIIYDNHIEIEREDDLADVTFELEGNVLTVTYEERGNDQTLTFYKEGSNEYNKALEEYNSKKK